MNIDSAEVAKFEAMASRWWDPEGECKLLHLLNPERLKFITGAVDIRGKDVLDVGCGGGILSESLCQQGAVVTGIDMAKEALRVAQLHALSANLTIDYQCATAEEFAEVRSGSFDVVTCMELLEHVPDPLSVIKACARMVKPGGYLFFSTLNRTPRSFLVAIVGAEYLLQLVPRGTHHYEKFIKPSEMTRMANAAGLNLINISGIYYSPLQRKFSLVKSLDVNYLACFKLA